MDRKAVVAGLLPALMLYACERAVEVPDPGAAVSTAETSASTAPPTADAVGPSSSNGGAPVLTPEAERGTKGARNILLSFARALEREQFDQAWAMLSAGDRQKWPKAELARRFSDLSDITVAIPEGVMEGAAGSSYYTAPIAVTATDQDGRPVRYEGEAVLRRVNDVDGATPAQLRWHFETLTLDWTH